MLKFLVLTFAVLMTTTVDSHAAGRLARIREKAHNLFSARPLQNIRARREIRSNPIPLKAAPVVTKKEAEKTKPRIPDTDNKYPEVLGIYGYSEDGKLAHPCSGTNINGCMLTAAHCVADTVTWDEKAGPIKLKKNNGEGGRRRDGDYRSGFNSSSRQVG